MFTYRFQNKNSLDSNSASFKIPWGSIFSQIKFTSLKNLLNLLEDRKETNLLPVRLHYLIVNRP